jgi:acylphosphatase
VQARRYIVRGRVQGVGFRWFVQRSAEALGVRGHTRNLGDGNVEVYAVGSAEQLSDLCGLLWKGPRMADVRGVDEEQAAVEKTSTFRIVG